MSSNKVNKSRGCRYYGRGHKKHKSGSKGGVGGAGKWSHNKGARKFRVIEKRNYDHYIPERSLLEIIQLMKAEGNCVGTEYLFKIGGKENSIIEYNLNSSEGSFILDSKFKKVLRSPKSESADTLPDTYKIVFE